MSRPAAAGLGRSCAVDGDQRPPLTVATVLDTDGLRVDDVSCQVTSGCGEVEAADHVALVLVRHGTFTRVVDGIPHLLDATQAYAISPGEEQRYDHTHSRGDGSTSVRLTRDLLAVVRRDVERLPQTPWATSPEVDLEHRRLLAAARAGDDPGLVHELTLSLVGAALAQHDARPPVPGRPATVRARHVLVASVREALAADPALTLSDLANAHGVSPFHLSRSFRTATGHTVARHRTRLRVRSALERLDQGEQSLSRLAADTGFADQSHLHRAIRAETGHTPGQLRRLLARR